MAEHFQAHASIAATLIQESLNRHLADLAALGRFLEIARGAGRADFEDFVQPLIDGGQGVQAYEWIPVVPREERADFEARAGLEWGAPFAITEREPDGRLIPAADRPTHYPVYFVAPLAGNEAARGFDLGSTTSRLTALEKAAGVGWPCATGRIRLVQENGSQSGFLVFSPVYGAAKSRGTEEQRRETLRGFALGVFRAGDMLENALASFPEHRIAVSLIDRDAPVGPGGPVPGR